MTEQHCGCIALQLLSLLGTKRRRRRDDVGPDAEGRGLFQSNEVGPGGILDRQPPIEKLVRLHVRAQRQGVRIVILREKA